MSLRISNSDFTRIEYAGQFLAAVIGKRPEWLNARVKDVFGNMLKTTVVVHVFCYFLLS